ncbi:hypothetical protein AB0H94_04720 [Streptomyces purpurascens]|uniref:hypothetical protein n=1 Tax=Streptomyces purpurascens TaxID=1924 RepID=UPI0033DF1AE0
MSVRILDNVTDSFAVLGPAVNGWQVRQGGPRRLWDAVESAVATWEEYGSPSTAAFGVTVSRDARWSGSGTRTARSGRCPPEAAATGRTTARRARGLRRRPQTTGAQVNRSSDVKSHVPYADRPPSSV